MNAIKIIFAPFATAWKMLAFVWNFFASCFTPTDPEYLASRNDAKPEEARENGTYGYDIDLDIEAYDQMTPFAMGGENFIMKEMMWGHNGLMSGGDGQP